MAFTLETELVNGRVVPYTGDHVLQLTPPRFVKQHIVCDDSENTVLGRHDQRL